MSMLKVKVVPGSSRTRIDGWLGEALKIRVTATPEKGKANHAVVALLAGCLGVPEEEISISAGAKSSRKTLNIKGLSDKDIRKRLGC